MPAVKRQPIIREAARQRRAETETGREQSERWARPLGLFGLRLLAKRPVRAILHESTNWPIWSSSDARTFGLVLGLRASAQAARSSLTDSGPSSGRLRIARTSSFVFEERAQRLDLFRRWDQPAPAAP